MALNHRAMTRWLAGLAVPVLVRLGLPGREPRRADDRDLVDEVSHRPGATARDSTSITQSDVVPGAREPMPNRRTAPTCVAKARVARENSTVR
jgi:hypothetical protein